MEVKKELVGTWSDSETRDIWTFTEIPPNESRGKLLISHDTQPPTARDFEYEIMWLSDNSIFIRLYIKIGLFSEHLITFINNKYINIQYPNRDSLVALNKA